MSKFDFCRGCVLTVLREALDEAGVCPSDIDAVAFTKGPGMKSHFSHKKSKKDILEIVESTFLPFLLIY